MNQNELDRSLSDGDLMRRLVRGTCRFEGALRKYVEQAQWDVIVVTETHDISRSCSVLVLEGVKRSTQFEHWVHDALLASCHGKLPRFWTFSIFMVDKQENVDSVARAFANWDWKPDIDQLVESLD